MHRSICSPHCAHPFEMPPLSVVRGGRATAHWRRTRGVLPGMGFQPSIDPSSPRDRTRDLVVFGPGVEQGMVHAHRGNCVVMENPPFLVLVLHSPFHGDLAFYHNLKT